jgi:hypothetical protein
MQDAQGHRATYQHDVVGRIARQEIIAAPAQPAQQAASTASAVAQANPQITPQVTTWHVSVRPTHIDRCAALIYKAAACGSGGIQRCGSNSCKREFGQAGSFVRMSLR